MVCSDEGFEDYQGDLLVSMGGKEAAGTLLEGGRGSRSQNLLDSGHQDFGTLLSLSTSTQDPPPGASKAWTWRPH